MAMAGMWLFPGTGLLSTSCTKEFRDSLIDAGAEFVQETASDVLSVLFPIGDWISAASGAW